jgi:hypothetical protein
MDFAFFAANFGYRRAEYEDLTPIEAAFLMKAWEQRHVLATSLMYKAVHTAEYNLNRKKGKKALELWKKRAGRRLEKEERQKIIETQRAAVEREKKGDREWIRKIYLANGMEIANGKL